MAYKQTLSVIPQIVEKNGFRQTKDVAPKTQRQMHEEVGSLHQQLKKARSALAQRDNEAELYKVRARQLADQWRVKLREAEDQLHRQREYRDRELQEITDQLRYFEAHLQVEQARIQERLDEKDEHFREQGLRVKKLESRNAELQLALKEAWKQSREKGLKKSGSVSSWSPEGNGNVHGSFNGGTNSLSNSFNGANGSLNGIFNGWTGSLSGSFNGGGNSLNSSFNGGGNSLNNSFSAGEDGGFLGGSFNRDLTKSLNKSDSMESQSQNGSVIQPSGNPAHRRTSEQYSSPSGYSTKSLPGYQHQDSGFSESLEPNTPINAITERKSERRYSNDVYKYTRSTSIPELPRPSTQGYGSFKPHNNIIDDTSLKPSTTNTSTGMPRTRSHPNLASHETHRNQETSYQSSLENVPCVSLEFSELSGVRGPGAADQGPRQSQDPGQLQAQDQAPGRSESPKDQIKRSFLRPRDVKKKSQLRARATSLRENQPTTTAASSSEKDKLAQSKRFFSFAF